MTVNINGEDRFYNDTYNKWTKKWYPRLKIWYLIIIAVCIVNLFLFHKGILTNKEYIIYFPFANWIMMSLLIFISYGIYSNYDYDYIEKYYPEISKKIWIYGRDNGIIKKTGSNELLSIKPGTDPIIDDIIIEQDKKFPLIIIPFIIGIVNTVVLEFI